MIVRRRHALPPPSHPNASLHIERVEAAVQDAAGDLAEALGIVVGDVTFEGIAFAGLCVACRPEYEGQPIPEVFEDHQFDNSEEWGNRP